MSVCVCWGLLSSMCACLTVCVVLQECENMAEFVAVSNVGRSARSTTATGANDTSSRRLLTNKRLKRRFKYSLCLLPKHFHEISFVFCLCAATLRC